MCVLLYPYGAQHSKKNGCSKKKEICTREEVVVYTCGLSNSPAFDWLEGRKMEFIAKFPLSKYIVRVYIIVITLKRTTHIFSLLLF